MGVNVVSFELPADSEEEVKQAIAGHVASILKMFQTRMDSQERENLANEIFEGLNSIGLVLTTR